jgi:site-specific recombinase XerD
MKNKLVTTTNNRQISTIVERLGQNPAAVYLAGLSESSRRPMAHALATVAEMLTGQADVLTVAWADLRFQHINLIRSQLAERYSVATANRTLSALRGTLEAARKLGQMTADDYQNAVDFKSIKGETIPAGRAIPPGELAALMDACSADQSAAGVRDGAIIALLYSCGLRRAELADLDLADFDQAANSLRVEGKGRKERLVYPAAGAAAALGDWLVIRGDGFGPLFTQIRKGGHVKANRLTTQAVYHILKERAAQAGIGDISPHDMRRTFVSDLLDAGADIATVQKMAGHANVTTTSRYDRRGEEAKRQAAGLLHVPYRRRPMVR